LVLPGDEADAVAFFSQSGSFAPTFHEFGAKIDHMVLYFAEEVSKIPPQVRKALMEADGFYLVPRRNNFLTTPDRETSCWGLNLREALARSYGFVRGYAV